MDMSKNYLNAAYRRSFHHLYKRQGFDRTAQYEQYDGSTYEACPCYYCGEPATHEDHAYPLVALASIYGLSDLPSPRLLVVLPACAECNGILADKVFPTLLRRKTHLKTRLRERYKRLLDIPLWGDAELGRLGQAMQEYVLLGLRQQRILERRLQW
jgi:hypothetical protein